MYLFQLEMLLKRNNAVIILYEADFKENGVTKQLFTSHTATINYYRLKPVVWKTLAKRIQSVNAKIQIL